MLAAADSPALRNTHGICARREPLRLRLKPKQLDLPQFHGRMQPATVRPKEELSLRPPASRPHHRVTARSIIASTRPESRLAGTKAKLMKRRG
jgi:hypothetical protein